MANGYSTSMVQPLVNQMTTTPQGVVNVIQVDETTPNLQMIQSFPVVSRNGNVHVHQDPVTGQMYEMTDEFHSMIPQIVAGNSNIMGGVIAGGGLTGGSMPTTGNKIIVGGNTSAILLKPAPLQPTVSINGLEYKQIPNQATITDVEKKETKTYQIFSIFPENAGSGTTYIDSVIYRQNNIPYADTETVITRMRESPESSQRQATNKVKFAYPSVPKVESSQTTRVSSISTSVKYVYPTV